MQQLISIETIPISIKYVGKPIVAAVDDLNSKLMSSDIKVGIAEASQSKSDSFVQSNNAGIHNLTYTASAQSTEGGKSELNIDISGEHIDTFSFYKFSRDIHNMISRIIESGRNSGKDINLPDFKIEILENPEVIIKYVGGPIYIPKSANPHYNDSAETVLKD